MENEKKVDGVETEKNTEGNEGLADVANPNVTDSEVDDEPEAKAERHQETPEARRGRLQRELTKLNKQLGIDEPEKSTRKSKKSSEFDEGQLAYLVAKGIEADEDIEFTQNELEKHGGSLRELLNNEYFQSKVKARKEAKATLEATPTTTKRSGSNTGDSVDYHYAKYMATGKLPEDREMAIKVVNMRQKKEVSKKMFTDNPVVGA